jgi:hypothetical protein
MKSLIPDWLPKLFVKAEGSVREATTKKFSQFNKITDTEGMEVVGIKGGANVRADFPAGAEAVEVTTSMVGLEPDDALRNTRGQFMSTKDLPELENQKDANRFIASEIQRLDQEIEGIDVDGGDVDLSDYATIEYVEEVELNVLNAATTIANDGDAVLQGQIDELEAPDLTGYATEDYVDDSIAAIEFPDGTDLGGYAKEEWVTEQIDAIPEPDLDGYATEDYVRGSIDGIVHPVYDDSEIKSDLSAETSARASGDRTLQAEITEMALALDTLLVQKTHGQWKYVGFMGDVMARNPGEFALGSDDLSASNNIVQLNNTDLNGLTVGMGDISVGDYVELVDVGNPSNFVLFVVAGEPNGQGISEIPVTLKEKGNNFLVNATCEIRFFAMNEQNVSISELDKRYLKLSGGTMNGGARIKVDTIEPVDMPFIHYEGDPESTDATGLINRSMMTKYVDSKVKGSLVHHVERLYQHKGQKYDGTVFRMLDENGAQTIYYKDFHTFEWQMPSDHYLRNMVGAEPNMGKFVICNEGGTTAWMSRGKVEIAGDWLRIDLDREGYWNQGSSGSYMSDQRWYDIKFMNCIRES